MSLVSSTGESLRLRKSREISSMEAKARSVSVVGSMGDWVESGIYHTSHNYHVELLYQHRTRRARSVFQRLALPTLVSISNGIRSG